MLLNENLLKIYNTWKIDKSMLEFISILSNPNIKTVWQTLQSYVNAKILI